MAEFKFGFDELWFRMIIKKLPDYPELFAVKEISNAQQVLRIGKLKVGAVRTWAEIAGLIKKKGKDHVLTPLGMAVAKFDPDMEEDGLWWLIHYNLARLDSPAWFYSYYINQFEPDDFSRQDLESELREYWAKDHKPLTDDMFHKLIYSPLKQVFEGTRLGNGRSGPGFKLFYETAVGKFSRDPKGNKQVHPAIVSYTICDWASKNERQTAHLEELLSPGAPGRILRLNRSSLDEMLVVIGDRYMKRVAWISHTANLNSVTITNIPALTMLISYYLELDGSEPINALEKAVDMVKGGVFGKWK